MRASRGGARGAEHDGTADRAALEVGTRKSVCGDARRPRGGLRVDRGRPSSQRAARPATRERGARGHAAGDAHRVTASPRSLRRFSAVRRRRGPGGRRQWDCASRGPPKGTARRDGRATPSILPHAARRKGGEAGSTPVRGAFVSHRISGGSRRLLLHDVTSPTPDAVRRATRAGPTVGSCAPAFPGGPVALGTDRGVRVAGKNRYTPRAGFAVTGGRAVGLPWDAPEVSETVFGSRARVEVRLASCPSTTHARASRRRARPLGCSGGPS